MTETEILKTARRIRYEQERDKKKTRQAEEQAEKQARENLLNEARARLENCGPQTYTGVWKDYFYESYFETEEDQATNYHLMERALKDGDRMRVTYELLKDEDDTLVQKDSH